LEEAVKSKYTSLDGKGFSGERLSLLVDFVALWQTTNDTKRLPSTKELFDFKFGKGR